MTLPTRFDAGRRRLLAASLGSVSVAPAFSQGMQGTQGIAAANREIYMYQGPDREERLLQGARKEGVVSVYTSLNTRDSGPLAAAFEKKYGVTVQLWRSGS